MHWAQLPQGGGAEEENGVASERNTNKFECMKGIKFKEESVDEQITTQQDLVSHYVPYLCLCICKSAAVF